MSEIIKCEIPSFSTKQESIDWAVKNNDLLIRERINGIKHSDYSDFCDYEANKAFSSASNKQVECLVYETLVKRDRNEYMYIQYKNGYVLNHSVGMRYIKYVLCVESDSPEYSQQKENWDKYYPMVINKDVADSRGWFYAVLECKNIEGSAVVKGSNFLTPVISVEEVSDGVLRVKAVINVCGVIDSHMDCHIPGCWTKTINENTYDLLLDGHVMRQQNVIADSINDGLKAFTENITIAKLASKFKANKSIEPSKDTQKQEAAESTSVGSSILLI